MGLSGPRKRAKISRDPNNTHWTRSEGFGHSLLVSQGWEPGQSLGARDAKHAHLYTAGSSSHVRATLKDDNLGLGAKRGSGQAAGECTGLDVFQGLLGRLNGKSEDALEKERKSREDFKRTVYSDRRFGSVTFLSGGLLAGDKIFYEEQGGVEAGRGHGQGAAGNGELEVSALPSLDCPEEREVPSEVVKEERKKKERRRVDEKAKTVIESEALSRTHLRAKEFLEENGSITVTLVDEKEAKKIRKEEKARKKAAKAAKVQRKLESKSASLIGAAASLPNKADAPSTPAMRQEAEGGNGKRRETPKAALDEPGRRALPAMSARHAVRQRFIRQKKLAVMDPKALREVWESVLSNSNFLMNQY